MYIYPVVMAPTPPAPPEYVEPAPETRKLARKVQAARKGESHETPPLEVASLTEPGAVGSGSRVPSRPRWRSRVLIGATMLIVVVVTAAYAVRGAWSQASPMPHSLALLPIRAIGSGMESPAAAIDEELNTAFIGERGLTIRPVSRSRRTALRSIARRRLICRRDGCADSCKRRRR
jgi:hypothetical protein